MCDQVSQPFGSAHQASNSSVEMKKKPNPTRDRCLEAFTSSIICLWFCPATDRLCYLRGERFTENQSPQKRGDAQTQREHGDIKTVILPMDIFQDSGHENTNSVVKGMGSFTQSIVGKFSN